MLRVGVCLTDISDFAVMSQAYSEHFAEPYPARTAIGVAALPLGGGRDGRGGGLSHGVRLLSGRRVHRPAIPSQVHGPVLAPAIGSGAIAVARTTAARWPRSGSCRRSGLRQG
ncbi:MAG: RidA family protein [Mycobacterium sp.]